MPELGMHDSLVWSALEGLPQPDLERFLADSVEYRARLSKMLDAQRRGLRVAPLYRRPVGEQCLHEAQRRESIGDVTAPAWAALAGSVRLAEAVSMWKAELSR